MNEILLNNENVSLVDIAHKNKESYINAKPFASIKFDNFFNPEFLDTILKEFPDLSLQNSIEFKDSKQVKFASKGEASFGIETKKFMHFLNSEPFLEFLQILTGIKEPLISDPYFYGGGQHEIKKGGLLKIHSDFNKHYILGLDRRINVLVYLNKDWKEEYGGHFELWTKDMKTCGNKILPTFNTMAIFSTTDFSFHGHPNPLNCPDDRSRKSLALYYYSNGRPFQEVNSGSSAYTTIFKERKENNEDAVVFKSNAKQNAISIIKDITPPIIFNTFRDLFYKN
jgi:hypothetical protein